MDFDGLKYQVYKSKTSNFFEDLIEFKLNYDGKLDIDDFNMFSKVMVTYFNTGVFNEFIGGKYKLCKLDGQEHYAMYDFLNKSPINNLYIAHDTYEEIEKKYNAEYVEKIENFINNIEGSIYDSTDNFITKRTKYSDKMKVVEFMLNDKELKFQDSFFKSDIGSHYAVNFKHQTLRNLLQEKLNMDTTLQTVFCADFSEHYKLLMKTFQHDFYPEFKDSAYQFNKQCHFMRDELDLLYMPPKTDHFEYSRNIDHSWVLFHQNNRYAGGAIISNSTVSEIRHISLKSSVENKDNFKKALDDILSSNICNQSVFIMTPQVQKYGLENELRNQYKDRQLYFNYSEKDAYFTLDSFIELNRLGFHDKKIKNDFYKNVILKNEKIFNSSDLLSYSYSANESVFDLLMDKFKLDVLKKYSKNASNLEEINRESFIRKCFVFQQGESNYKYYLQNDYEGMDFAFRIPLDGNGTTDLLNMVKDFILYQNINYSQDIYEGIYASINQNKQIATHESTNAQFLTYSYHSLYETLSDLGCIKTNQDLTYVFRLEMTDGKGLYTSAFKDDYITNSNDANILEYDQRKVPQRDNGLSTLFLAYDSRHLITNSYADNYNFAFSSKEQMLRWFGKSELDKIEAQGTKLYRCEVPQVNVIASKVQVAFNKNKVISKVELKLGEFLQNEETPTVKKIKKFKI